MDWRRVLTVAALTGATASARADTLVLTPHVEGDVTNESRELALRIGEAMRAGALVNDARVGEVRTLPTIAAAFGCDPQAPPCLQLIAGTLSAGVVLSGELASHGQVLTLQRYQYTSGALRRIREVVTRDLIGERFHDWVEHLVRRLDGTAEGIVVIRRERFASDARLSAAGKPIVFNVPMFMPVGRHPVFLESNGERSQIGLLEVVDGQRTERQLFVDQVNGMRVGPPRLGCNGCTTADANVVNTGLLLFVVMAARRRRRA